MLRRLQLNRMGGTATKEYFPQSRHYQIIDYGYCKVWRRTDTQKQTMEQYEIVIDSQKMLQSYKRMWLLRAQEQSVVGVYYFTHRDNKDICGFYQNGSILTERIPYRLSQFSNVPYQEMLYILKIALHSYRMLHLQFGLFLVRSTMIGINCQKEIKLWHHTDFSAAQPENVHCRNMTEMIDSIIESVEINAELPCYYPPFSQFVKVNRGKIKPTFEETLKAISTYIKMNRIPKCQNIPKLSSYLRQAEGRQQLTYNSNFLTNLSNISQLNKSSYGKYSFRGNSDNNSSVSSSRKTLKNSPGALNVYTQRQVRQDYRSRERSHLKSSRSQKIEPLPQPQPYRYHYSPKPLDWRNHQNTQLMSDLRGKSIDKSNNINKIEIVIPSKRVAVSPAPKASTVSSIDRRIYQSPQHFNVSDYESGQKESDFKATLPLRTNRFQQAGNYMQRRNDSMSPPQSGVYYHRN